MRTLVNQRTNEFPAGSALSSNDICASTLPLEPGELLLWLGRPDPKLFRSEAWAACVFGLLPLAAGCVACLLVKFSYSQGERSPLLAIPALVGLGFLAIGLNLLSTPWRAPRRLAKSAYALTDRRALIFHPPGWTACGMLPAPRLATYSFYFDDICGRRLKRRSRNRTDIVFAQEIHRSARGRRNSIDLGFLGLREWREVEAQMARQFSYAAKELE